jgi:hypothetical protein
LGLNRKTVGRYWRQYQAAQRVLEQEPANQQFFLDAHICFFEQLQGVYSTVVYDNMRNVVKRFVGRHEKELNDELVKMALYYRFEPSLQRS